jgi:uncharacterized membrane protein YesL
MKWKTIINKLIHTGIAWCFMFGLMCIPLAVHHDYDVSKLVDNAVLLTFATPIGLALYWMVQKL